MTKGIDKPNSIYSSDYFKVDKAKLNELGVFDPILNHDTKLFVDPILLKSSSNEIFQKARERYINFFNGLLKLLKSSEQVDDRFWRAAKQRSKFSEYKYTCIGYGDDSIDGTGPGSSFSDKLLESAKDIIEAAKDDSEMFLLLPLLEDGMGADGISDMTQSIIDDDIGLSWFEQTKKDKKESLLRALKEDDDLFVEVLKVLKEYTFEPYDVELDHRGVHRWLKDSEKFIAELTPGLGQIEDSLEAIHELVQEIVTSFKDLIENKNMKGLFWADVRGTNKHVNEFYSQMLFFMVSKMWLAAQNSNVDVSYGKLVETDQFNIKFTVSGSHVVLVQIKHANNTSLQSAFQKHIEYVQGELGLNSIVAVLNFKDKDTAQFTAIKEVRYEDCSLIEIHAQQDSTEKEERSIPSDVEVSDLTFELEDFKDAFIELEDFDWQFDENYTEEKRRGGQQRHRKTTEIKEKLIHPMFSNRALIKGKSVKQRAEKISGELSQIPSMSETDIELFSKKYGVKLLALKKASPYFENDRKDQIYKWCLAILKELKNEN